MIASELRVYLFGHGEEWHWEILGGARPEFRPVDGCCDEAQRNLRRCAGFPSKILAERDGHRRHEELARETARSASSASAS